MTNNITDIKTPLAADVNWLHTNTAPYNEAEYVRDAIRRYARLTRHHQGMHRKHKVLIAEYYTAIERLEVESSNHWQQSLEYAHLERLARERLIKLVQPNRITQHGERWARLWATHEQTMRDYADYQQAREVVA